MVEGEGEGTDAGAAETASAVMGGPVSLLVAGLSKIGEGILSTLTKIMTTIIDSSPYLQGILKIIDKMFKLVLMPIGNIIARILTPLAIKMATKAVKMFDAYSSTDPDKLMATATSGFSLALDSMIEMMSVVLTKVLVPIIGAGLSALGTVIWNAIQGKSTTVNLESPELSTQSDMQDLMGMSATSLYSLVDQFGLAISTGNGVMTDATGDLSTVFYNGASSIEDGFQATTKAVIVGGENLSGTMGGLTASSSSLIGNINTTVSSFIDLNTTLNEVSSTISSVFSPTGISRSVTLPEALSTKSSSNKTSSNSTVNVNFYGDVYGMDDFNTRVKNSVGLGMNNVQLKGSY